MLELGEGATESGMARGCGTCATNSPNLPLGVGHLKMICTFEDITDLIQECRLERHGPLLMLESGGSSVVWEMRK